MLPLSKPARAVHGTEPLHSRSLLELGARKPPTRPEKFKIWMEEAMASGCLAVERGESGRTAATSTMYPRVLYMHDRISGKVATGSTSGPERYLMMKRRKSC